MKDELISIIEQRGFPVYQQGSLGEDEAYPDTFFTFWNNDTYDGNHYDGKAASWTWSFDVNVYSTDPDLVNSELLEIKTLLIAAGWIIGGKGHDVASDEISHTGRGITVLYRELNREE